MLVAAQSLDRAAGGEAGSVPVDRSELAPYLLAVDMAEVMAVVRGAIRYRVLVL